MGKLLWAYEKAKFKLWLLHISISKALCSHETFCLKRSLDENTGMFRPWHMQNLVLPDPTVFSCTPLDSVLQELSVAPLQRHYLFIAFKSLAEISRTFNCLYVCCEFPSVLPVSEEEARRKMLTAPITVSWATFLSLPGTPRFQCAAKILVLKSHN